MILCVFMFLFHKMAVFYIPSILFFPVTCYSTTLKKEWGLPGPLNQSPALSSTRARCDSRDAEYVCLVYKHSSEQIPHFSGLFSPLSVRTIHTASRSDINCKQRAFWIWHVNGCLLKMSLRFMAQCSDGNACGSLFISLVYSEVKVQRKSQGDS